MVLRYLENRLWVVDLLREANCWSMLERYELWPEGRGRGWRLYTCHALKFNVPANMSMAVVIMSHTWSYFLRPEVDRVTNPRSFRNEAVLVCFIAMSRLDRTVDSIECLRSPNSTSTWPVGIGCPRIIRTLYFDVLKEGRSNFIFRLYSAAWSA